MQRHLGLLVKNLPPHLPSASIKQFFDKYAKVSDIYTFRRSPFGGHTGQSLIHFENAVELNKALKLNGRSLKDYKLIVEPTVEAAHEIDIPIERPVRTKFRSQLLYVTGQPLDSTEEELTRAFRKFGTVRWIEQSHQDRKKFAFAYAFVMYESPDFATKAYESGVYIRDNIKLKISFFKRPIKYPKDGNFSFQDKAGKRRR
ncbi:hypothetical protein E3Q23_00842 [Wallemia mellicola]|uniref:RRM domain-containing protein n=1 Tax=Wallemia mellicola TaxID=1708541 RepID=A0A4T0QQX8_9BASI|nr:hypothetical protein E3Q23_00842 [Wallemia mellicola]TIB84925.1 hypothetical protein E3Q21_02201 [Wallemia mellicola]TIB88138.1 hypothetical protein E3Q20_02181 [Wallemia mellicola]TIC26771.1 hypothetical protein E3Q12_00222 [Wallemia mellicola]TIC40273.1 hypothetical protein E3Q07_02256 [Wallemia mellicola]